MDQTQQAKDAEMVLKHLDHLPLLLPMARNIAELVDISKKRGLLRHIEPSVVIGQDYYFTFDADAMYVDNTANTQSATVQFDNMPLVFSIPGGVGKYIPCKGAKQYKVSGSGKVNIMYANDDMHYVDNGISSAQLTGPGTAQGNPLFTSLTGSIPKQKPEITVLGNATITDLSNHYYFNDVNFPIVDFTARSSGKKMIYIRNGGTQSATVNVNVNPSIGNPNPGNNAIQVWTGSIAAGANKILTSVDAPALDNPLFQIWVLVNYPVASTSGVFYSEVTY